MRLAWLTDPHLNFLPWGEVEAFCRRLANAPVDAYLISGDIGEADSVERYLALLVRHLARPIFFVLGNHDYYGGGIAALRERVSSLCRATPRLRWLPSAGVVELAPEVALVGCDGWADGRYGDYAGSRVMLTDYQVIADLAGRAPLARLAKLHQLGDDAASSLAGVLPSALDRYRRVLLLTHVPPFPEACRHEGRLQGDDWLPHMACRAVGDLLLATMRARPDREVTVLCGHTHSAASVAPLPNLMVRCGAAAYGAPAIQEVLDVE